MKQHGGRAEKTAPNPMSAAEMQRKKCAENFALFGLISLAGHVEPLYISNKTNYGVIYKIDLSTEQMRSELDAGGADFPASTREMR